MKVGKKQTLILKSGHKSICFLAVLFFLAFSSYGQNSISGQIFTESGQPLAGAAFSYNEYKTFSNSEGEYNTKSINTEKVAISVSYIGYKTLDTLITLRGTLKLDIKLQPQSTQLNEVIVQSKSQQIREQRNSAISTQLVDQSYIRENLGGSLMQTLEKLGGVNTIAIGSGQSKPIIRGLSFNRVVVTENGIKHEGQQWGADHGLEIDQYAVGSLRLIKGPTSLMYGSDAIAGVIEIESPKPPADNTLGGAADVTYKSNNSLYGSSINLYGRKNKLFFNTRVTVLDYADYKVPVDYVTIYSYRAPLYKNRLRNTAGRELNLHLNAGYVSDNFSSVFYISNLKSKSGLFANAHGLEPRNVDTDMYDASDRDIHNPYQDVNHFKVINRTKLTLNNHKLEADFGYQNNFRQEFSDYITHGFMPPVYPENLPIDENLERGFSKNIYSLNAKDLVSIGNHTLTVGVNADYQDNNIGGWGFVIPGFTQSSAGIYAIEKWEFSKQWIFHAGLRYDYGHIKTENYYDWFTSPLDNQPTYLQRSVALSRSFNSPSWSVGVNYNREHLFLRANVGKSFRMPIAKELASNGVNYHQFSYEVGDAGLAAEKAYQLDLGATYEKGGFFTDVSPFVSYFSNYIYLNPTPGYDYAYGAGNQIFEYTQSKVLRYGAEARVNYNFLEHYTAGVTAEFVRSEQLSGVKKGYSLPFSPPASVLFSLNYKKPLKTAFKEIRAGADFRMVGAQNIIVPPENKTAAYNVINLMFGTSVKMGKQELEINLQAQNLLNSKNFNHTSFYRLIGVPEPGRNIIASVKIPFSFK